MDAIMKCGFDLKNCTDLIGSISMDGQGTVTGTLRNRPLPHRHIPSPRSGARTLAVGLIPRTTSSPHPVPRSVTTDSTYIENATLSFALDTGRFSFF
jgi:hypothetical protein